MSSLGGLQMAVVKNIKYEYCYLFSGSDLGHF